MPLQILDAPWSLISVNFITDLPLSNGADAIMVVVDRFTKFAEFFLAQSLLMLRSGVHFLEGGFLLSRPAKGDCL